MMGWACLHTSTHSGFYPWEQFCFSWYFQYNLTKLDVITANYWMYKSVNIPLPKNILKLSHIWRMISILFGFRNVYWTCFHIFLCGHFILSKSTVCSTAVLRLFDSIPVVPSLAGGFYVEQHECGFALRYCFNTDAQLSRPSWR